MDKRQLMMLGIQSIDGQMDRESSNKILFSPYTASFVLEPHMHVVYSITLYFHKLNKDNLLYTQRTCRILEKILQQVATGTVKTINNNYPLPGVNRI